MGSTSLFEAVVSLLFSLMLLRFSSFSVELDMYFHSFFFKNFFFNLAVPGLGYGRWDLLSSLWHVVIFSWGMWDLVPWPGMELEPSALGAWSLSHWKVPMFSLLKEKSSKTFTSFLKKNDHWNLWLWLWEDGITCAFHWWVLPVRKSAC